MAAKLARVLAALHHRLDTATTADLARGMGYPTRWDPSSPATWHWLTPTRHYDFHRRQLTLTTTA